jgi:hypothetical protein
MIQEENYKQKQRSRPTSSYRHIKLEHSLIMRSYSNRINTSDVYFLAGVPILAEEWVQRFVTETKI